MATELPRAADELIAILGSIPADELAQRQRIYSARSISSYRAHSPQGPNGRSLLWMAADCANHFIFAAWPVEALKEVADFCELVIDAADRAARLETPDGLA